ncbi:MAG: hypothetical protein PHG60_03190, partial [Candidatus Dojkabacteria bacterium]|nr:hypothetical protein [Candidatus Dojkabacteria bacterium]
WATSTSAGLRNWNFIVSFSDGEGLIATASGGYVYFSHNGGINWIEYVGVGSRSWTSLASSVDGSKVFVAATAFDGDMVAGSIYSLVEYAAPEIEVKSAINLSPSAISFVAYINTPHYVRGVEYCTTGSSPTPCETFENRTEESGAFRFGQISLTAENLDSKSFYHYRFYAENGSGRTYSGVYTKLLNYEEWEQKILPAGNGFRDISSSSDGMKLAVIEVFGYIYTSIDGGESWVERTSAGERTWVSIDSSADGTKLVAVAGGHVGAGLYTSDDSGVTWTLRDIKTLNGYLYSAALSNDGMNLVAVEEAGYIFTSRDGGESWTEQIGFAEGTWGRPVASSADGSKLIAGGSKYISISKDYGVTWRKATEALGEYGWISVASSADGEKLVAAPQYDDYIYTSKDGGQTWINSTESLGKKYWSSVTCSDDGEIILASTYEIIMYLSIDGGRTWSETGAGVGLSPYLESVTSSSDGTRLFAADSLRGHIYTFKNDLPKAQNVKVLHYQR